MKTLVRISALGLALGSPVWGAPPTTTTTTVRPPTTTTTTVRRPTTTTTTLPGNRADADKDGVVDASDRCAATAAKEVVDKGGCSVVQHCPCPAPRGAAKWQSHGEYVKCIRKALSAFRRAKRLSARLAGDALKSARGSQCGKTASKPVRVGRIRCCRSHSAVGAQPMCVAMTARKCAAKRGKNLGAGSCNPNPCR